VSGRLKLTSAYDATELLVLAYVLQKTPLLQVRKAIQKAQNTIKHHDSDQNQLIKSSVMRAAQRKIWHAFDRRAQPSNSGWK
jgi:uncharacterized Fe-S cluster-containing MiaB family protein